jgi:hypothetical protein
MPNRLVLPIQPGGERLPAAMGCPLHQRRAQPSGLLLLKQLPRPSSTLETRLSDELETQALGSRDSSHLFRAPSACRARVLLGRCLLSRRAHFLSADHSCHLCRRPRRKAAHNIQIRTIINGLSRLVREQTTPLLVGAPTSNQSRQCFAVTLQCLNADWPMAIFLH